MKHICSASLICALFSLPIQAGEPDAKDRILVPGARVGAITKKTNRAQLDQIYGKENVKDMTVDGPEGSELKATVLFPDKPEDRLELLWREDDATKFEAVRLQGEKSNWKSADGITLGSGLKTIEKINGKAFKVYGFEWDYGGYVSSFEGGKLDGNPGTTFGIRFSTKADDVLKKAVGDAEFPSSLEELQKANPSVSELTIRLEPLAADKTAEDGDAPDTKEPEKAAKPDASAKDE